MKAKLALTALGAAVLSSVLPAATASADSLLTLNNSPEVSVISIGDPEFDDPAEDVLEHATILGTTEMHG
ncbi:hypothetical protein [Streptomyces sp. CAU 1734]|uniref:hypothetical protein n=1 Tax=Streptomyces sp. CAU 1734 TaxID=3140360 RepID=UPI0032618ABC